MSCNPLRMLALALTACSTGSASAPITDAQREGTPIPACSWPRDASTLAMGCTARSVFEVCGVPSGSVVESDGEVVTPDGAATPCTDACASTEYTLFCTGAAPAPDPSMGCRVLPVSDVGETYCCPCE
jgi:hypothetical protein